MPILSNDQHYTFIAEGRTSINLVLDAGSMASVFIRRSVSEGSQQKYYESATVTGIYPGDTVTIAAESGSVTYTVTNLSAVYATDASGNVAGLVGPDGSQIPAFATKTPILQGASAGANSGWLPISSAPERFAYQLDSGSTTTTFSMDISADGVSSLGQAFTGTWASSTLAEITFPVMFSNPQAKFFRWNVVSGGPLSVYRGA